MIRSLITKKRSSFLATALTGFLAAGASVQAIALDELHFLIPGGAGGGWDSTARGTGEALTKSGLVDTISYENMSGGGGGKAIAHLIETAAQQGDTLMVNSTPIVIRSLSKVFPQSFRDLTPVAATIGDFGAFVVRADSPYTSFEQVAEAFVKNPRSVKVAGGSARGSMDHLVAAMAFKAAGGDPRRVKYVAYDAGGKAMASLLSGETDILSTGLSEALTLADAGEVRVLVMTGEERSDAAPQVPTLKELGYDTSFVNWRGFFGAPNLSEDRKAEFVQTLEQMYDTAEWKEVRARYGWSEIFKPDQKFVAFLSDQEKEVGSLMRELGFLK
ncbi:tripartite tricarboxylate transporter substrate binding protein [Endozoicomonas sp.]|uniref:tripartite tricarboxylate transporter substrate binding protein n=1 Tax=Endozoicomonas sp. TaxID=1892382 RepID=UPI003AF8044E